MGGSAQKPSELALLTVGSVDDLMKARPGDWQSLRKSTTVQVGCAVGWGAVTAVGSGYTGIQALQSSTTSLVLHGAKGCAQTCNCSGLQRVVC